MDKREIKLSRKEIYDGAILKVEVDEVRCPNGNISHREVIRKGEACCIVAEIDGKIIMEKQFRYPYDTELIEVPAGKLDPNEDIEKCAIRELEEETGYLAHTIKKLGKIYPTVAFCDEVIHIYYATDLEKTHRHLDENEVIDFYFDSLKNVLSQIKKGEIVDSKTICAIQLYQLMKAGE